MASAVARVVDAAPPPPHGAVLLPSLAMLAYALPEPDSDVVEREAEASAAADKIAGYLDAHFQAPAILALLDAGLAWQADAPRPVPPKDPAGFAAAAPPSQLAVAADLPPALLADTAAAPRVTAALAVGLLTGVAEPERVFSHLAAAAAATAEPGPVVARMAALLANAPFLFPVALRAIVACDNPEPSLVALLVRLRPDALQAVRAGLLAHPTGPRAIAAALELTLAHARAELPAVVEAALALPECVAKLARDGGLDAVVDALVSVTPASAGPAHVAAALKLIAAILGVAKASVGDDVLVRALQLITAHAGRSGLVCRIGLCFLLVVPSLTAAVGNDTVWEALRALRTSSEATNLLLLISIHFHTGAHVAVADTVRRLLGMRVALHNESLSAMAKLFTSVQLFDEREVARSAPQLVVPSPLTASAASHSTALESMYHLCKSSVLTRHQVDVSAWVWDAVAAADYPLHPLLPALVAGLVASSDPSLPWSMALFELDALSKALEAKTGALARPLSASAVLLIFYVLSVNYRALTASSSTIAACKYPDEFVEALPLQALWVQMASERAPLGSKDASGLALVEPAMAKMMLGLAPHAFTVVQLVAMGTTALPAAHMPPISLFRRQREAMAATGAELAAEVESAVRDGDGPLLATALERGAVWMWRMRGAGGNKLRSAVVKHVVGREVAGALSSTASAALYWLLWGAMQETAWQVVCEIVAHLQEAPTLTPAQLAHDPLLFLRLPDEAFTVAPLVELVLHGLHMGLAAATSSVLRTKAGTREETSTLLMGQECAVVLMAIEAVGVAAREGAEEAMAVLCQFVHEKFIANVLLCKLVHFQMYSPELIPLLVAGVPSMHVASSFMPELLMAPSTEHVRFGILVMAALAERYPLPSMCDVAGLAVGRASEVAGEGDSIISAAAEQLREVFGAHLRPHTRPGGEPGRG
ncbi:uncharacterized protein AMSG_03745 [Thecamonas trahens ATCC 50062]|uniref:Integrator complex subunit 2 n=1 Tax=Thecamonas trahens ATCC 50062 TaxID=461836 RepID=A0A0L0D5E8_THETB|nr:hypothetical protein AMSG_03745 [Thecamonas trahens ATCC 50062]KNC47311.1 hypothetical protein AMSG_03745 [Thecamonas trahens ATCC 50062]|eukprot:XP_013759652.1 hypothetical protein AMSG_03745 [Thecamonas trahens ATCC 50062]